MSIGKKPLISITEYSSFVSGREIPGYETLPERTFAQLENFLLTTRSESADGLELMSVSARKGVGRMITAKNYVGVIAMNDGTTIEILPKIFSPGADNGKARRLVVDMLRTLRDAPYKSLQRTNLDTERLPLLEIFISMFIDEVFTVVKHGLRSDYEPVQESERFIKGKILFSEQIKRNTNRRDKTYIRYDVYSQNRPENRLIKATLQMLWQRTGSVRNKARLKTLLSAFSDVATSSNYDADFAKCVSDRNMRDYRAAIQWCRVFLNGLSFSAYSGSTVALTLLFPMETLFESYMAAKLKHRLPVDEFSMSVQDKKYYLFDEPRQFSLRPDIVVTRKADEAVFVMDTKWKILSDKASNHGISQSDMYQMYVYQKKYQAQSVTLLYPMTDKVDRSEPIIYCANDGVTVRAEFIDLMNIESGMDDLEKILRGRDV